MATDRPQGKRTLQAPAIQVSKPNKYDKGCPFSRAAVALASIYFTKWSTLARWTAKMWAPHFGSPLTRVYPSQDKHVCCAIAVSMMSWIFVFGENLMSSSIQKTKFKAPLARKASWHKGKKYS